MPREHFNNSAERALANKAFWDAILAEALREQTGMYLATLGRMRRENEPMGDPMLEGSGVPCRPDAVVYLTPKENCRNCGAAPETKHPHACGWCLTPR